MRDKHAVFLRLRQHPCCWREGSGTQCLSGAPLTFFSATGKPPAVLKHIFMQLIWHLQEAQANSCPWGTNARCCLDSKMRKYSWEQTKLQNYLLQGTAHFLSCSPSTSVYEGQAQTLKRPFTFDKQLFFKVSFSLTYIDSLLVPSQLLQPHSARN